MAGSMMDLRRAECALFVPEDAAQTRFVGFVRVGEDEFKVRVSGVRYAVSEATVKHTARPLRMLLDAARVDAERPLASLLAPHEALLKVRLRQASSLEGFVRELQELVAVSAPRSSSVSSSPPTALPDTTYYNQLMAELDVVGWHRLTHLGDDLRMLELQTQDAGGRAHAVRVTLASDYPATPPLCAVDAPAEFTLQWPRGDASTGRRRPTLQTILEQFELFLQEYQTFWNVLDVIDARCCVLEPHHPSRATGRRRLALQRHVSVQVEVSPTHPRGLCELKFFGSDATVAPLRERWSDHLFEWEDHRSVAQNLEVLLDVELPSPATTKTEEFALECGICYCYRLDVRDDADGNPAPAEESVIPDRLCENPKCNRPFHEKCLFEWLKALPTARQSFSTVFGECPYCREAISAKFVA